MNLQFHWCRKSKIRYRGTRCLLGLLVTDNRIINLAGKNPAITIRVENPVSWLMEVSADENNQ